MVDAPRSMDVIELNWYFPPEDVEAVVQALREADAEAEIDIKPPPQGFILIPVIIGVVIGVLAGAKAIIEVVCRIRQTGMIYDSRVNPPDVRPAADLPQGEASRGR